MGTPRGLGPIVRLVLLAALVGAAGTCGGQGEPGPPEAGACPYRTPEEWQAFLDRWASDERWAPTCEEGECDAAFYQEVDEGVRRVFDACADLVARSPGIDACTANLRRFAPRWMKQHSPDSYGFEIDNHAYFAAQEGPGEPEGMMTPRPEMVAAVPDAEKVVAVLRDYGWRYVQQTSCLGGSRIFVVVPDPAGRFDQWTLLNVLDASPSVVDVTRTMSFVAVQKRDASGAPLPRVRLHFRDYMLAAAPEGGYRVTLDDHGLTKCYACHPSGARQIIPRRTSMLSALPVRGEPGYPEGPAPEGFALARLGELNHRLASYGMPDWNGLVDVESLGPRLGQDLGCTGCHNGATRGPITLMTS